MKMASLLVSVALFLQGDIQPTNSLPNAYQTIKDWAKMPGTRAWGSTSAVEIDKDGKSVWVAERCGQNSCLDRATGQMSPLAPILKFDPSGKLVKSFGEGMLIFPHGIFVDREGNVWVTDGQDNAPQPARGEGPRGEAPRGSGPIGPRPGATKGNQVYKFSPEGKLLMTLGKPGGAAEPDYFYQPNDVLVAPSGDIFVAEIHGAGGGFIYKFDKTGKFLMNWGRLTGGPEPGRGELNQPHSLAMDSKGRLFVASRSCNCMQIFDQNGTFIDQWAQFSRPSGVF